MNINSSTHVLPIFIHVNWIFYVCGIRIWWGSNLNNKVKYQHMPSSMKEGMRCANDLFHLKDFSGFLWS